MYKRILLAVDGSDNSVRAAHEAIKIAANVPDAMIEILYVILPPRTARQILLEPTDEEMAEIKGEILRPIAEKIEAKGITVKKTLLKGEAADTIIEHEHENEYDLLVIGSRGLGAVRKFVQGSVSSRVAEKARCPVLLVK